MSCSEKFVEPMRTVGRGPVAAGLAAAAGDAAGLAAGLAAGFGLAAGLIWWERRARLEASRESG